MIISKVQRMTPLKMTGNSKVLELMCDEEVDVDSYFEGIREVETIEEEPDNACLLTCTTAE